MLKKMTFLAATLFLGACMGTGPFGTAPLATTAMPTGEKVDAPSAFRDFCLRNPSECKLPSSQNVMKALNEANTKTRSLIVPTEEEGDTWETRTQPGPGDCEDFALTMRSILRGRFPEYSGAFLIATAYTEENTYHAVLSIETDAGTIVCDIRYASCAPWENYPYSWRLREVAGADHWQQLGPYRATGVQTATADSGR